MKSIIIIGFIGVFGLGCIGAGYIYGGTNLGYAGYPDFSGNEPSKPWDKKDEWTNDSYKNDVQNYISEAQEYIDNAENDIKRIKAGVEDAIEKSDNIVKEYNDWVMYD